jgi:hypothetical protein
LSRSAGSGHSQVTDARVDDPLSGTRLKVPWPVEEDAGLFTPARRAMVIVMLSVANVRSPYAGSLLSMMSPSRMGCRTWCDRTSGASSLELRTYDLRLPGAPGSGRGEMVAHGSGEGDLQRPDTTGRGTDEAGAGDRPSTVRFGSVEAEGVGFEPTRSARPLTVSRWSASVPASFRSSPYCPR